jgi:hypothetical protein
MWERQNVQLQCISLLCTNASTAPTEHNQITGTKGCTEQSHCLKYILGRVFYL